MTDDPNRRLVDVLDEVWRSTAELGAALMVAEWALPTECPGWSVQDHLVHVTAVERFLLGDPLPDAELADGLAHVKNEFGRRNEQWIEARRSWSGPEVLDEFRATAAARLEWLRGLDDAGFAQPTWTPLGERPLALMLDLRILDAWVHQQDMRRAVGRPGDLEVAAAGRSVDLMFELLPFVVGKKAALPDGCTLVLVLTGPLRRTVALEVVDRKARVLDTVPASPTVALALDSETYVRLACGRVDPDAVLVAGDVAIDGDVALGSAVVRELNQMF
jgi:uncharacterized protein (TIGR03083 family)